MLPPIAARLWSRLSGSGLGGVFRELEVRSGWDGAGIHRHRQSSAVLALEGSVRVETGLRQHRDLAAGELALIGPWVWHAHPPPRTGALAIIGLRHHDLDVCLMWPGGEWVGLVDRDGGPVAAALRPDAGADALRRLVAWLGRSQPHPDTTPEPLRRMSDFLWRHRISPVGAAAVLASSGLGYSAANRLFRESFGATAKQYLLQCRLELAEHLLAAGHPPGAIWAACGFASRADLTRRFRLTHGRAPRRWARERSPAGPGRGAADPGPA